MSMGQRGAGNNWLVENRRGQRAARRKPRNLSFTKISRFDFVLDAESGIRERGHDMIRSQIFESSRKTQRLEKEKGEKF